jgi:hypothetical protein
MTTVYLRLLAQVGVGNDVSDNLGQETIFCYGESCDAGDKEPEQITVKLAKTFTIYKHIVTICAVWYKGY